ncbi:hypothetical protein STAFG_3458 [Streptomyces afghaniensis 772]|uniref:Major facilitator superfamily (MFS) profile domain-containing protein n=2 Tax=Streptomyces TaxID=1883 RepID=S4MZQ5_9ACTN|nr:hypothetical protein STAFG_3458 [Streptomyces afghaniensis 772]
MNVEGGAMNVSEHDAGRPARSGSAWALTILTLCAFTLGTGEIMIAGILPDLAAAADVSLSTAGLLVSMFALTVVVGGPVLALTTTTARRSRLLGVLLSLFVLGTALSALTSSFAVMTTGRIAAALAHSALMPLFFGLAADAVPAHKRGTAVARVSLGLSLAMLVGLPIGTALGQWLSWRAPFAAVALLALAATGPVLTLAKGTPAAEEPGAAANRRAEIRVLAERRVQAVVVVTTLTAAAAFTAYTYITPLLTSAVGFTPSGVTILLLLFGIGGTVGNLLGGKLTDRSATRAACLAVAALAGSLLLLGATVTIKPLAVLFLFLFGAAYYAVIPAVNTRMLNVASRRARTLALTVQSSAFNLGIAAGGWAGGEAIAGGGDLRRLPLVGGLIAVLALVVVCAEHRGSRRGEAIGDTGQDAPRRSDATSGASA